MKTGCGEPGNVGVLFETVKVRSITFITKNAHDLLNIILLIFSVPTSYILINSDLGTDESIISKLKDILADEKDVQYEIQGVYGVYDIVLKLTSDNVDTLRSTITNKIRKITSVQSTLTMMVIEEQGKP